MSKVFLEKGSIRISLTAEEARSSGFLSHQPHSLLRSTDSDGALYLVYSSDPSPSAPQILRGSVVVWIPPVPISRESVASPVPSTIRPAESHIS